MIWILLSWYDLMIFLMVMNSMQLMKLIHDFIYQFMTMNSYHTCDDLSIQYLWRISWKHVWVPSSEGTKVPHHDLRSVELWPQVSHKPSHHWLTHRRPENSCQSSVQAVQNRKVCRNTSCTVLTPDIQPNLSPRTQQHIELRTTVQVLSPEVFEP